LKAVLFISHRTARVTVVLRTASGWDEREFRAGETVSLSEPAVSLPIDELYAGISLDAE
jgi:hypothetical protein